MSENTPKTDKPKPKRKAPRTAFKPGQSGNPGGRPPMTESQRESKELLAEGGPVAVRYLKSVVIDEAAPRKERIAAAKVFVDKIEAMKLEVKVDTTDDTGIVEMMKRMAGIEEKPG
jgi:hypothetical protein